LQNFSYSYEALERKNLNGPFRELMRFEVGRARNLLEEGRPLLGTLPRRLRWQVELMWSGPMRILEKLEATGFDVFSKRPALSKRELVGLFLRHRMSRR